MRRLSTFTTRLRAVALCTIAAAGAACLDPGPLEDDDESADPDLAEEDDGPPLPQGIHAVDTLDGGAPTTDLAPFLAATAGASVIGLGEAIHTSGGYYALKERLIRGLVEEQGVRVFVIETPRSYTSPLDTFVNTPGCAEQAAINSTNGSLFAVFVDDNFIELLVALCRFNEGQPEGSRVRIFGTDAQQPDADIAAIDAFLREQITADAQALLDGLSTCSATVEGFGTTTYSVDDFTACTAGLDALEEHVEGARPGLVGLGAELRLFELHIASYRSWQEQAYLYGIEDYVGSYTARDLVMGEAFLVQQELFFPDERAVFWAHDYHLAAAHDEAFLNFPPGAVTAGTVLKDVLGDAYMPFAITSSETAINWPGVSFSEFPANGVEDELAELEPDLLFVDETAELLQRNGASGLGDMALNLRDNYSGLFWLRTSEAMDAIYW